MSTSEELNEATATRFAGYSLQVAAKFRNPESLFRNRLKLLRRSYRPLLPGLARARRVLDWGCGSGDLLLFLAQATQAEIVGFEPSRSQLELARERCGGLRRVCCVAEPAKIEGSFDYVFSSHVIEHVPDPELGAFFGAMLARLAPGGKLVVATPNGMNPLAHAFYMSTDTTHVRMHSPFTLSELAQPLGFEVAEVHRETPQAYDLPSFAKTAVWWLSSGVLKLALLATAGGVRGLRFPLVMAPTLYCVIEAARPERAGEGAG